MTWVFPATELKKCCSGTRTVLLRSSCFIALDAAIAEAAADGCTRFLSGMSTGFDLWAAEAVLRARVALPVQLLCAVPFDGQADRFPLEWKRRFNRMSARRR